MTALVVVAVSMAYFVQDYSIAVLRILRIRHVVIDVHFCCWHLRLSDCLMIYFVNANVSQVRLA